MPKLFLVFSHKLTEAQQSEAFTKLAVEDIYYLPDELQEVWSHLPPELPQVADYIQPIKDWLQMNAQEGDYILIQGDYGATYQMVKWALANKCVPIYSTTERKTEETLKNGRVIINRVFEHVRFRFYE